MKVTREKEENRQVFLSIELESAEMEKGLEQAYRKLAKKANVPGFRKGKAPREVLERYLGKESLLEEALNSLIPEAYEKALEEEKIEPIANPSIEIAQTEPVIFKATVPLRPVTELGDYKSINMKPEPPEVDEDGAKNVIEQLRRQRGTWEPAERAAAFDDMVTMDVESQVEGEPFINQQGVQYQLLETQSAPAPGFVQQFLGMKGGEEKEFKLHLPKDYAQAEMADKDAQFKVKVLEVKQLRLPKLDSEFARSVDPEFKTMAALRKRVSDNLRQMAEDKVKAEFEEKVVDAVVDLSKVEFPPVMVDMEVTNLLDQQAQQLQASNIGLEEYLGRIGKTEEQLREEMRPSATKRISRSLVLSEVSEAEKIEVGDDEIKAEVETMVAGVGGDKEEMMKRFDTPELRSSVKQMLTTRKAVQRLVEMAGGSTSVAQE